MARSTGGKRSFTRGNAFVGAAVALIVVAVVGCSSSDTVSTSSDGAPAPPVDAGVVAITIPGARAAIHDLVVDEQGCAIAGTGSWGVGEVPIVWSGADCAAALLGAPTESPEAPGTWSEVGDSKITEDKTILRALVRSTSASPILGVGYREEHSDLFPTDALVFDVGNPRDAGPTDDPSQPPVRSRDAMADGHEVVLHDIDRLDSGRLIITGARRGPAGRGPSIWWSDDELATWNEVPLPNTHSRWSEAQQTVVGSDGRLVVHGHGTPTDLVTDQQAIIWWSDDAGATWQEASHDGSFAGPPAIHLNGVAEGSEGWVAVGNSYTTGDDEQALLWRSTDGTDWRLDTDAPVKDERSALTAVVGDPDGRLVVFGTALVGASPDDEPRYVAVAWEQVEGGWRARVLGDDRPRLAAGDPRNWVAVGSTTLWSAGGV